MFCRIVISRCLRATRYTRRYFKLSSGKKKGNEDWNISRVKMNCSRIKSHFSQLRKSVFITFRAYRIAYPSLGIHVINRISARLFPVVKYLQRTRVFFFFFPCNLFHGKQNRRAYHGHRNCINFIINWPILALFPPHGIIDVRSNEHRSWFRCTRTKTESFDNFLLFFFLPPREFCFGNFAVKYSISILVGRWSIRRENLYSAGIIIPYGL